MDTKCIWIKICSVLFLCSCSCSNKTGCNQDNFLTVECIKKQCLDVELSNLKENRFLDNYEVNDTIIFDEENEELYYKSVQVAQNDTVLFLLESDIISHSRVKRITIVSNLIQTKNGITVGTAIGELKKHVKHDNLNSQPDGFLGLIDKENDDIIYMIDIEDKEDKEDKEELFYGISSIDSLPSDLVVERIVLRCK
jgi:hypothetical protein